MFDEQDGGMLDYYDLTTARGKRNKKKIQKDEERNKQKIFISNSFIQKII